MKKCPQCNSVFNDDILFCFHDGTPLVEDPPPTVAFNQPINPAFVVDLSPKEEMPTQITPFPPNFAAAQTKTSPPSRSYVAPLLLGLLIGAALVLTTIFLVRDYSGSNGEPKDEAGAKSNKNAQKTNANTAQSNRENDSKSSTVAANIETNSAGDANESNVSSNSTPKKKGNYNGRVIMLNAYLRSAPSEYAPELEILPMDSTIKIGKRAASNSPWYKVTTENGTTGWMHGNTIEFAK